MLVRLRREYQSHQNQLNMNMNPEDLPTYKDSPDSSKDFQQCEEKDSIYEREYVEHGISCHRIGCTCTPKSDSDKFAEERAAAIRRLHAGRNERARHAK